MKAVSNRTLSRAELDRRFLQTVVENKEWFEAHEADLLREHPEWWDHFLAVCSRAPSKILAVSEYHGDAGEKGLQSPELLELAAREGVPPGCLFHIMLLGDSSLFDERPLWDVP